MIGCVDAGLADLARELRAVRIVGDQREAMRIAPRARTIAERKSFSSAR